MSYIAREQVINMFQNLAYDDWNQGASTTWATAYDEAVEMVRLIPSADVEPIRHGRWVDENGDTVRVIDGVPEKSCWCGSCGEWLVGSDENEIKGHYCPNCGAKNG